METLSAYNEQLKQKLDINMTYQDIIKTFIFLDTLKLLNKTLNFVPTPKKYN